MENKFLLILVLMVFAISFASAVTNVTDGYIQTTGWVFADSFVGDGSQITDIVYSESDPKWSANQSSYVPWSQLWGQVYNETEIGLINSSMKNYVDSNPGNYITSGSLAPYATWTTLWAQVYNETEIAAINTSMKNYVDTRGFGIGDVTWTTLWSQTYNKTEIGLINASMKNYVDSIPTGGTDWTTIWSQIYNETEVNNLLLPKITWTIASNGTLALTSAFADYYTKTESDLTNTSLNNYIVYTNTTLANYVNTENTRFNTTLANYINTENTRVNTTLANYANTQDTLYNNTLAAYVNSEDTRVNTTMQNYVDTRGYLTSYTETDPHWTGNQSNYVPYTQLWSQVYNKTESDLTNTSLNNYIVYSNTTLANYVNTENTRVNTTMQNYVDTRGYLTSGNLAPYSTLSYLTSAHYNKTEADNLLAPKVD